MNTSNPGVTICREGTRKKIKMAVVRNGRMIHERRLPLARMKRFLKVFRSIADKRDLPALRCEQTKLVTL